MEGTSTTSSHAPVAPWKDRTRFPIQGKRATAWKPRRRSAGVPAMTFSPPAGVPGHWTFAVCGAVHPERPGIVDHKTGEKIADAVTCTGWTATDRKTGERRAHAGKHRARVLTGLLERWEDDARSPETQRRSMADLIRRARSLRKPAA